MKVNDPSVWASLATIPLCVLVLTVVSRKEPALPPILPVRSVRSPTRPAKDEKGPPVVNLAAPPMGFMSWERFRCEIDCYTHPDECISEKLYMEMADAMVEGGYVHAGFNRVDIDDCWAAPERDPDTHRLIPDPKRFPSGMVFLSNYMAKKGIILGIYGDVGTHTCAGYPGSQGYELLDAQTFADWGVGYLKLDGCYMDSKDYATYYTRWGAALKQVAAQQPIVFSCSWPAYLGDNETSKPFTQMYQEAGCNTWRNYADIDNSWDSVKGIIQHWAEYWQVLRDNSPNGAFHDADMLVVGDDHYNKLLSPAQARVQMGFWAIITSPLFIGGDVRTISEEYFPILLNREILAINQDGGRHMGSCVLGCPQTREKDTIKSQSTAPDLQHVWRKELIGGHSVAFGFFNLADEKVKATHVEHTFSPGTRIAKCHDLWAPGRTLLNLCPNTTSFSDASSPRVFKSARWDIIISQDANGSVVLSVTVKEMAPTSHEMIRIDLLEVNRAAQD